MGRSGVVQEIALAKQATLHCGDDEISWFDFANAVALLVETESVSRRLSEVVRGDKQFGFVPAWFHTVPTLGAARLVKTTSLLFRTSITGKRQKLSTLELNWITTPRSVCSLSRCPRYLQALERHIIQSSVALIDTNLYGVFRLVTDS